MGVGLRWYLRNRSLDNLNVSSLRGPSVVSSVHPAGIAVGAPPPSFLSVFKRRNGFLSRAPQTARERKEVMELGRYSDSVLLPSFSSDGPSLNPNLSPDLCTISEADKIAVKAITEGDSLDTHLTGKFPHLPQISEVIPDLTP